MRNVLLKNLTERKDDFLFITADIGYRVVEVLRDKLPDKFLNTGVNEQFMASFAAGVAKTRPSFIYSIANFSTLRCLEQIRNDICLHNLPVCVVSVGGGFGYGALGASHHNLEDIACLGAMPGMNVFMPSSKKEVEVATDFFFENKSPTYLRLSNLSIECEVGNAPNLEGNFFIKSERSKILIISNGYLLTSLFNVLQKNDKDSKYDLYSFFKFSEESFKKINFENYETIITYDESSFNGSSACLLHKYLSDNEINIKVNSYYVTDYTAIPGGSAEFYRSKFSMSQEDMKKKLFG